MCIEKYKKDQVKGIEDLFGSLEIHTRNFIQMHCLASHFTACFKRNHIPNFTKLYFGKLNGKCVTTENYINGDFTKYINNTGNLVADDVGSEVATKVETFAHFTYEKSGTQLMVLDIQGVGYNLSDPMIDCKCPAR